MKYINVDTGEVWSEEELRKLFEQFHDDDAIYDEFDEFAGYRHDNFKNYLEDQLSLGRGGQGGIVEAKWYAVQKSSEDEWNNGSYDIEEAKKMLREQGCGLIAVIDEEHGVCEEEIRYEDLD